MKGFIRLTNVFNKEMLINTRHIVCCYEDWRDKIKDGVVVEKIKGTSVDLENAYKFAIEDYATVCDMIANAQKG